MVKPNNKLPLIAWIFGLVALGASWWALWSSGWMAVVLIIATVLAIGIAGAALWTWFRQMKAQEEGNGTGTETRR